MYTRPKQKQSGFTIVELLIVIVVIGILAAISIVAYNGIQNRAQLAKAQSDMNGAVKKIEISNADTSTYPNSITDCPSPAPSNICLTPVAGDSYTYKPIPAGLNGSSTVTNPAYELTVGNASQFVYLSNAEKTGSNEFTQYVDLAPIIDKYGLVKYQLSFDIKSANTATNANVNVYFQNGSSTRYSGLSQNVVVTTSYTHQTLTFTPILSSPAVPAATLAFYGTYSTGNISSVSNVRVQVAP
jgi:prepilin-type N-terminal cleavage/methylation domain-containing protein